MNAQSPGPAACHNCRRGRLKCDRAQPKCEKCQTRGEECLGYGRLLRWQQGIASRGHMTGKTYKTTAIDQRISKIHYMLSPTIQQVSAALHDHAEPTFPLIPGVSLSSATDAGTQRYLSYFATDVCKDLVLYDTAHSNPFRQLLAISTECPLLIPIISANAALHMANALQRMSSSIGGSGNDFSSKWADSSNELGFQHRKAYRDALMAKQKALSLLQAAIAKGDRLDTDVILAVVLLFIEFELIDSGRDDWQHHINGARALISALCGPDIASQPSSMTPLRRCLVSNRLVFDIVGSTLATPRGFIGGSLSTGALCLLRDAEGNHCSSFPTALLQLMHAGARLLQPCHNSSSTHELSEAIIEQAQQLLAQAHIFDAKVWAAEVQARSPVADLEQRTHVALAHRAGVIIYLSAVVRRISPQAAFPRRTAEAVAEVIKHLKCIDFKEALFTATPWPAFIAGAEAEDEESQRWVAEWFGMLWEAEPWGLIREALGLLERIWTDRQNSSTLEGKDALQGDWIGHLGQRGVHWLIL